MPNINLDRLDAERLAELERQVAAGETTREEADRIAATIRGAATKQPAAHWPTCWDARPSRRR